MFDMVADLGLRGENPRNIEDSPGGPWWTSCRLMASLEQLGLALADLWVRSGVCRPPEDNQLAYLTLNLQLLMRGAAQLLVNFITYATNGLSNLRWSPAGRGPRRAAPAFLAAASACLGALSALLIVLCTTDARGPVMMGPSGSAPVGVRRGTGVWCGQNGDDAACKPSFRPHLVDILDWINLVCDCYRLAGHRWRQLDRLGEGCCPSTRELFEGKTASQVGCRPLLLIGGLLSAQILIRSTDVYPCLPALLSTHPCCLHAHTWPHLPVLAVRRRCFCGPGAS